ncbi:MAG: TPM domain-containing protein [Paludibacteraceae bacterium]|nr:TPM domain-containing protein [Paludibacteraceae bacterium]
MKRITYILLSLFCAITTYAATYKSVNEIKMVYLEDSTRYVCNPDGILSEDSVAQMDAMIEYLEDSTSIQIVVVAVEKIESGDCFQFATDLGNLHGIGQKKKNNGLVILLSTKDRCIQFATGSGLEGYLPDAICKRIQNRYMNEALSQGLYDKGMTAGVRAVCGYLDGSMKPEIDDEGGDSDIFMNILGFLGLTGLLSWYIRRKMKKCPNCKKIGLEKKSCTLLAETSTYKRYEDVYVCKYCGQTVKRPYTIATGTRSSGGGFSSGSFGGDISDPGGHFGGGHFGGGGAGSRF